MMKSIELANNIEDKKIFLRLDWNVPIKDGKILNDSRIKATLPTVEYLLKKNCRVIIGTHLGRPDEDVGEELSTRILAKRFSKYISAKVFSTDHVIEPVVKKQVENLKLGEILVLGNLRYYPDEEANNSSFARILASYGDAFVNDAFAVCHRAHASVDAIVKFLPGYAGLLLEKEVGSLKLLSQRPRRPFILVLGGAKIKDKAKLLIKFAPLVDKILIGGAIANTLRFFQGNEISSSIYEPRLEVLAEQILIATKDKIVLPVDDKRKELANGEFSIMDIGPKTIDNFKTIISEAKTIFWNGNMGKSEEKEFEAGTLEIAKAIKANLYTKIVAGGDTVGFIDSKNMTEDFSFISTGGGAALEFLAGEELPALRALEYYSK